MNYNLKDIQRDLPKEGSVIVYWLGGAGFVFKFATGEVICIDPYLSDCVERMFGFRRLSLAPIQPEDLRFDYLLLTHDHMDHMDVDSFETLVKANPGCHIIAPECCEDFLNSKGIAYKLTYPAITHKCGSIQVEATKADHGELCSSAVGFLMTFANHTLYFTGDTGYNETFMSPIIAAKPDIVIPCINGAYGNLSEDESSTLVAKCQAKTTIPAHFWLFAEHGGNPETFRTQVAAKSPQTQVLLLTPGRGQEI